MRLEPPTKQLQQAAQAHKGTDLGGLLQWAALHIENQQEALCQQGAEIDFLTQENKKMHAAIKGIMQKADDLSAAAYNAHPVRDYVGAVDAAPYINIMGAHYKDPEYMRGKLPAPHIDTRDGPQRKQR